MPTVPTEQNRVGIAGVTDAKLQPGDYSGTGLQALGAGMQQLGGTGAKIAGEMQERQDRDDDLEVKKAWNAYAEGARGIRADALGKFDTDPQGMLDSMTRDYGGLRDWIRSGLKNDRQRGRFDHVIAERFDYDISGALGSAEQAMRLGQNQQSVLLERNAADDAVDNSDNPVLFDKHLQTGAESIVGRAVARGDDPATIEHSVTAYGSRIRRRAVESLIDRDPIAAADRYRLMRDQMTPADRQASEVDLLEPLARTVAAQEVDKLLLPEERDSALSPERRAAIAQQIEAQPLSEALKRYALDDLNDRGSLEMRARKRAADAARETSLAAAEQLGSAFTSITQIPAAVRRDLDDATDQALKSMALANLDPTPVTPGGETSLMMNIMASENPVAFAKEDLRLIRGKVAPEEYDGLVRLQQVAGTGQSATGMATQRRIAQMIGQEGLRMPQSIAADGADRPVDWQGATGALSRAPMPASGADGLDGAPVLAAARKAMPVAGKKRPAKAGKAAGRTPVPWPELPPPPDLPLVRDWPIPGNHQPAQKNVIGSNGLAFSDGQYSSKGLYRTQNGKPHAHLGIDLPDKKGNPVAAAADGIVLASDILPKSWGNYVAIRHPDGYVTLYAHLDTRAKLKVGQQIARGTQIGTVGNTGNAGRSGTHLHFEVRVDNRTSAKDSTLVRGNRTVDPVAWMNGTISE